MRVFMLGWEFRPFISGGLGTACYGLTKAMSGIGTDVMFVLRRSVAKPFADRFDSTVEHDDFTQPGNLNRLFDDGHRDRLTTRIAGALGQARHEVQLRQLCHFFRADPGYGQCVAAKLGIDVSEFQGGKKREAVSAGAM